MYRKYFKRLLDIICAVLALTVFSWLYILIAILVKIKLGSPVLFSQERPGKDEKIFKLYKFRTMTDDRNENGELLPDEKRLSPLGLRLRKYSLDEIPEAINILKGDMSVVGPRPLLVQYLPLYNDEQRRRHETRPGLTGLAQINGRNIISWEEKFSLDIEYVGKVNFWLDIKIIFLTIIKAIQRNDISYKGNLTMPIYTGVRESESHIV